MSEWDIRYSEQFKRDIKRMQKRYPREVRQMFINLEEYKSRLQLHDNPLLMVEFSFVHRESSGCHAITQQPLSSAAQTRLYLYCYLVKNELHLICAGDKTSQPKDNRYCAEYVRNINK